MSAAIPMATSGGDVDICAIRGNGNEVAQDSWGRNRVILRVGRGEESAEGSSAVVPAV